MKEGVAAIWDGIKAVFAAPINFVIRYILNDGLFKAWNWIVDTLNLPGHDAAVGASGSWKLHVDEIPGFETGGYTGNMPATAPAGVVHGGEFVFTKAQTDAAGLDQLYAYAAALDGRSGGFYKGGHVSSALISVLPGFAPGGAVPGAMTWSQLWATVHGHDSRAVLTSAYRPGASDYHGAGAGHRRQLPGQPAEPADAAGRLDRVHLPLLHRADPQPERLDQERQGHGPARAVGCGDVGGAPEPRPLGDDPRRPRGRWGAGQSGGNHRPVR
jgi:hypothetical protein